MAGGIHPADSDQPLSDINVTPLVDVMLVLLVIFILLAPMFAQAMRVDLPKVAAPQSEEPHVVDLVLNLEGQLLFNDEVLSVEAMQQVLTTRFATSPKLVVRLNVDSAVHYGEVAALMAAVRAAGIQRLAFATRGEAVAP